MPNYSFARTLKLVFFRELQEATSNNTFATRSLRPVCVSRDGTALFGKSSKLDFLSLRCSVVTGEASLIPLLVSRVRSREVLFWLLETCLVGDYKCFKNIVLKFGGPRLKSLAGNLPGEAAELYLFINV